MILDAGVGVAQSPEEASKAFQAACEAGNQTGCAWWGDRLVRGKGVAKDIPRGMALIRRSCEAHDGDACWILGKASQDKIPGAPNSESSVREAFSDACRFGNPAACNDLGSLMVKKQPPDFEAAFTAFRHSCALGRFPGGCENLAQLYRMGQGTSKDTAKASEYYEIACNAGRINSCLNLATILADPQHPTNPDRAISLFRMACDRGSATGCGNLAIAYENGKYVEKDFQKAALFYDGACSKGAAWACKHLGALYESGKNGLPKDNQEAARLFSKACSAGDASSCAESGRLKKN
jgi:uncharacterized protein